MADDFWVDSSDIYTDIYLEILREAQRIEDRKLVRLIGRRLREIGRVSPASAECCEVILFPGSCVSAAPSPALASGPATLPDSTSFWPRFGFRHVLWFFSVYISLLLGGLMI